MTEERKSMGMETKAKNEREREMSRRMTNRSEMGMGNEMGMESGKRKLGRGMRWVAVAAIVAVGVWLPAGMMGCGGKATAEDARKFVGDAEKRLLDLVNEAGQAAWVQANFITDDTQAISAKAQERLTAANTELAIAATKFDGLQLPEETARKLKLLKLAITLPAPNNEAERAELTKISTSLEADYGKGKWCPDEKKRDACLDISAISQLLAESRDPQKMLEAWNGWHTISPRMKRRYAREVELANKGAKELGFADVGAMWRSNYDMEPAAFAQELDRLWAQVRPLYDSLHTYVRGRLEKQYGAKWMPADGMIPAHLTGNLWAQQWNNIYPLVAPPAGDPGYDLTKILKARKYAPKEMTKTGENFFVSLGFAELPGTFWERSLFTKPRDRDVVCHASAWDVDNVDDLRIKMCIEITAEDFGVIHHELGHNFYQRAYNTLPFLFRDSANDGFHEAVGDTIALSVTPEYLKQIGLIQRVPGAEGDLGLLMNMALEKVAFLPFGLTIDQWRWKVFSGEVKPAEYNKAWWELRKKYMRVAPLTERGEEWFDAGAKYHVPANVPYMRYFLADILQFQFHRALCKEAGYTGPLHRCSIYGNKKAGEKLAKMLAMGKSKPWQEALFAMTGQREMDATAILDYFAPLKKWMEEQNQKK